MTWLWVGEKKMKVRENRRDGAGLILASFVADRFSEDFPTHHDHTST